MVKRRFNFFTLLHVLNRPFARMMKLRESAGIRYCGQVANVILLVALGIGLYTRWQHSHETAILVVAALGLVVLAACFLMVYYFSMYQTGTCLGRLWMGCLLGIITFTTSEKFDSEVLEEAMDVMLLSSIAFQCCWNIAQRLMRLIPITQTFTLLKTLDLMEIIGVLTAAVMTGRDFIPVMLLIISLAIIAVSIRLKSLLGVLNLALLSVMTSVICFPLLGFKANPYALVCFATRLTFEPLIDLYFLNLTTLERWQNFLDRSKLLRFLSVLGTTIIEIILIVISAINIPGHKEWFIVVPLFTLLGVIWLCFHLVFIITCWILMRKITDCNVTYHSLSEESKSLNRIMAAKGVRHFSLISQRVVLFTLVTTVSIMAVTWRTKNALSIGLLMVVIPIECMMLSLLMELGSAIGGRSIGYALVAPITTYRAVSGPVVLPSDMIQEFGTRSTQIMTAVQQFFAYHLIENYGCDYSSSGLSADGVESKLKSFFSRQTADGPRHDTYIVYYSGHVHENGDWALADENLLKLDSILEWWKERNSSSGARLVLILDTEFSHQWIREVCKLPEEYVGVQTCTISKTNDPEVSQSGIGDFTMDWIAYNCTNNNSEIDWKDKERVVRAVYGVSRHWPDFRFHLPTEEDIAMHWHSNFPRLTKPLIKVTNCLKIGDTSLFCFCDGFVRCVKRQKMSWLPPSELDTGHGFKLIRS